MEKVVIIGSGPAGLTAALYTARAGYKTTLFTGDMPGGMLAQIDNMDNYPGFPDGINGYELADAMQRQAEKFGAVIEYLNVAKVDFSGEHLKLWDSDGKEWEPETVIIATGTRHKHLGLPGEEELLGHGISYCAVCDGPLWKGKKVAVAGNGRIALEEAAFLCKFASEVHLLNSEAEFKANALLVKRVLDMPQIVRHDNCECCALHGVEQKSLQGLTLVSNGKEEFLACDALFVAVGLQPGTAVFQGQLEMEGNAIRLPAAGSQMTSREGVFAAGDCADRDYRQVIVAAGAGAQAAMEAVNWLKKNGLG